MSAFGVTTSRTYTLQGQPSVIQTKRGDGTNYYREELRYTAPSHSTPLYSGGISEIESRTGTTFVATDAFEYDGAGRLAGNARYVGQSLTSSYSEGGISYDRNGNMKTISRYGESGVTPVQDFSYVLAGNRVSRTAGTSGTYRYDANGNMTHDPYRFSSKETQTVGSIGWLDFGARLYDPVICRWTSPDPLAEKYRSLTPYGYCAGDPVNLVDPDGCTIVVKDVVDNKPVEYTWEERKENPLTVKKDDRFQY